MFIKLELFVRNILEIILFFYRVIRHRSFCRDLKKDRKGKVLILANGPSIKDTLPILLSNNVANLEFVVLNFFAFDDAFFKLKPKHYCLADPMFFGSGYNSDNVNKLYTILDKRVNWNLNLYVPISAYRHSFRKFNNSNIEIIRINDVQYSGFESFRNFFYKSNLALPRSQTVAILAIFIALNKGFTDIDLYGVDHSFTETLVVDNNNRLCNKDRHFYDKETDVELKPIIRPDNNQPWKIGEYLEAIARMFKSHDLLSSYADYLGVNIVNRTSVSFIDSYKRV